MFESTELSSLSNLLNNITPKSAKNTLLVLDIDKTLLFPAVDKYSMVPKLLEQALSIHLRSLKELGCEIILLTAREEEHYQVTKEHLQLLGLEYDTLLHAPSKVENGQKIITKGSELANYLMDLNQIGSFNFKLIVLIDDKSENLVNISETLRNQPFLQNIRQELYHYIPDYRLFEEEKFPCDLSSCQYVKALGGGTGSVHEIKDKRNDKSFVLKVGANLEAIKIEIIMNKLYQLLGVAVPHMEAYYYLPKHLAKHMRLSDTVTIVQCAEKLTHVNEENKEKIVTEVFKKQAMVHMLLGNIDIKLDNYIIGTDGEVYCIDAGANYMFRSLGNPRNESPYLLTEYDTFMDKKFNPITKAWLGGLPEKEVQDQVNFILDQRKEINTLIWSLSKALELPAELQETLIDAMADRLNMLAYRTNFKERIQVNPDKKAVLNQTAAGILTLRTNPETQKIEVLLSKRVRHNWWANFGGKSDAADNSLVNTALREVYHENPFLNVSFNQ